MSVANSDDNDNSIHFIDNGNNEFEYIDERDEVDAAQHDHEHDENADESYYTIEIEDDFDTDFEKDSLIA